MSQPRGKRVRLPDVDARAGPGGQRKTGRYMNDILTSHTRVKKMQEDFANEEKERKRLNNAVQNMYNSELLSYTRAGGGRMDGLAVSQPLGKQQSSQFGNNSSVDINIDNDAAMCPSEPDPAPPDMNAIRQLGQMTTGNENPYRRVLSLLSNGAVSAQGALGISSLRAADATQQRAKHLMISADAHRKITQIAYSAAMKIVIAPELYQNAYGSNEEGGNGNENNRYQYRDNQMRSQANLINQELQQNEMSVRVLMEAINLLSEICTSSGQAQARMQGGAGFSTNTFASDGKGKSGDDTDATSNGANGNNNTNDNNNNNNNNGGGGTGSGDGDRTGNSGNGNNNNNDNNNNDNASGSNGTKQSSNAGSSDANSGNSGASIQLNTSGMSGTSDVVDRQTTGGNLSPSDQSLFCNNNFTAPETLLCCCTVIEPSSIKAVAGVSSSKSDKSIGSGSQQSDMAQSMSINMGGLSLNSGMGSNICTPVQVIINNDLQQLSNLSNQISVSNEILSGNSQYFSIATLCLKVLSLIMIDHLLSFQPMKSSVRGANGKIIVNDIQNCISLLEIVKILTNAKIIPNITRNGLSIGNRGNSNVQKDKQSDGTQASQKQSSIFKLSDACTIFQILGRMCEWGVGRRQLTTDTAYVISEKALNNFFTSNDSSNNNSNSGSNNNNGINNNNNNNRSMNNRTFVYNSTEDNVTNNLIERNKAYLQDPGFKNALLIILWFIKEARMIIGCSIAGENDPNYPVKDMLSLLVCATYVLNGLAKSQLLRVQLLHLGIFEILAHLIDYSDISVPSPAKQVLPPQLYENIAGIMARYCSSDPSLFSQIQSSGNIVGMGMFGGQYSISGMGSMEQSNALKDRSTNKNSSSFYCRKMFLSSPLIYNLGTFFSVNSSSTAADSTSSKMVRYLSSYILKNISGEKEIRMSIDSNSGSAGGKKIGATGKGGKKGVKVQKSAESRGLKLASGIVSLLNSSAQSLQTGSLTQNSIEVASFMNARHAVISLCVQRPERYTVLSTISDVMDGITDIGSPLTINPPATELEIANKNTNEFAKARIVDTIRSTMNMCNNNEDNWGPGANVIMCSCIQMLTEILRVPEGRNSLKGTFNSSTKIEGMSFSQLPLPIVLINMLQSTNKELVRVSAECLANACKSSEAANIVVSGCCNNSTSLNSPSSVNSTCTDGIRILLSLLPMGDKKLIEAISRCITLAIANCTNACVATAMAASGQSKQAGGSVSANTFVTHRIGICYGSCLEGIMSQLKAAVLDVQNSVSALLSKLAEVNISLTNINESPSADRTESTEFTFMGRSSMNPNNTSYNYMSGTAMNMNSPQDPQSNISMMNPGANSMMGPGSLDMVPVEFFKNVDEANNLLGSILGLISALCRDEENCKILGELGLVETIASIDFKWGIRTLKISNNVIASIQKMSSSADSTGKQSNSRNPFYVSTQPIRLIMYFTALIINLMSNVEGNISKFHSFGLDNVLLMFLSSSKTEIGKTYKRPTPLYSDSYPWPSLVDVSRVSCTAVSSLSISSLVTFSILSNKKSPKLLLKLVGSEDRETQESAAKALKNMRTHKIYESETVKKNSHM